MNVGFGYVSKIVICQLNGNNFLTNSPKMCTFTLYFTFIYMVDYYGVFFGS